jgi:hypothetical protein
MSLPKGWVYAAEEVGVKVEAEVVDPNLYQMLDTLLTRSKRKALAPPDVHPHHPSWLRAQSRPLLHTLPYPKRAWR